MPAFAHNASTCSKNSVNAARFARRNRASVL